jgi:hypothetical protein
MGTTHNHSLYPKWRVFTCTQHEGVFTFVSLRHKYFTLMFYARLDTTKAQFDICLHFTCLSRQQTIYHTLSDVSVLCHIPIWICVMLMLLVTWKHSNCLFLNIITNKTLVRTLGVPNTQEEATNLSTHRLMFFHSDSKMFEFKLLVCILRLSNNCNFSYVPQVHICIWGQFYTPSCNSDKREHQLL